MPVTRRRVSGLVGGLLAVLLGLTLGAPAHAAGGYVADPTGDVSVGPPRPTVVPPKAHRPGYDITGVHAKNGRNVMVMTAYLRKPKVRSNVVVSFSVRAKAWGALPSAEVRVMRRKDGTKAGPSLLIWDGYSYGVRRACSGMSARWFPSGSRRVVVTVPQRCWQSLGGNGRKRVSVATMSTWTDMHGLDFGGTRWLRWD